MSHLGYPQQIQYERYLDCVKRTKQNVSLSDDVVYYLLSTCSVVQNDNRGFQKTSNVIDIINKRLCPGQWCTRTHCENYNYHRAYNCNKTRPKVCSVYKKYIEKQELKKLKQDEKVQ